MSSPTFRSPRHTRAIVIADWQDAEELAAWHMRTFLGHEDAQVTSRGNDRGLDVTANHAAAQVKHHAANVGAPEIQQAAGAAHVYELTVFYSQNGYTPQAVDYADAARVALFTYTIYGDVHPANSAARDALTTGATRTNQTWSRTQRKTDAWRSLMSRLLHEIAATRDQAQNLANRLRLQTDLDQDAGAIGMVLAECATFVNPSLTEVAKAVRRAEMMEVKEGDYRRDIAHWAATEWADLRQEIKRTFEEGVDALPDLIVPLHDWHMREHHIVAWANACTSDPRIKQVITAAERSMRYILGGEIYEPITRRWDKPRAVRNDPEEYPFIDWIQVRTLARLDPLNLGGRQTRKLLQAHIKRHELDYLRM